MENYAERALLEYNNEEFSPRPGGVNGSPFWNVKSTQFMFVPILQFPDIPSEGAYLYTATDKNGKVYWFFFKCWGQVNCVLIFCHCEGL